MRLWRLTGALKRSDGTEKEYMRLRDAQRAAEEEEG